MAVNDFNRLAPFYDTIAKLVFGDQLINIQTHFLQHIKPDDSLLILGGGTGEILHHLPNCKKVVYVEKSAKMVEKASSRNVDVDIEFVTANFLEFDSAVQFDWVICPFFLDCFSKETLSEVLIKIRSSLKQTGHLLISDFQQTNSNSFILKLMHLFFRVLANLEAKSLQNIHEVVISTGFETIKEKFSHRNQLFSRLYRNL